MKKKIYYYFKDKFMEYTKFKHPRIYISILYHDRLRRWINWKNPKDLNEKINWLKFYSDTSMWTVCADKLKMREYVKSCNCEKILVPLYGIWKNASDIPFDKLPEKFVLKPNHGCGDVIIISNKNEVNWESICNRLQESVEKKFGYELAEWHYLDIPPTILCEELLEPNNQKLIDYKIWCFNGKPYYILTCSERDIETHNTYFNLFDIEWNRLNHYITSKYRNNIKVEKPLHLSKMLEYAEKLSVPFPQVRIDFYEVNGNIYIGELTFTSRAGIMDYFTKECLLEMGSKIILPNKMNSNQ